jgi:hypothetical protein
MMRLWIVIFLFILACSAFSLLACQPPVTADDDAAAAAILWWVEQPMFAGCDTVYVSYPGGQNPTYRFLSRFTDSGICVLPYSLWSNRAPVDTIQESPWKGGIHLALSPQQRWDGDSLSFRYYWHYAPLYGGGGELIMARYDDQWSVLLRREYTVE